MHITNIIKGIIGSMVVALVSTSCSSEIGDNYSISRQAISDSINQSIKSLEMYESKLQMIAKTKEFIDSLTKLSKISNDSKFSNEINAIIENLRR